MLVQALHYLAQVPSNRPLMKSEVGLLISIRRIISRSVPTVYYSNSDMITAVKQLLHRKINYSFEGWGGGGWRVMKICDPRRCICVLCS